MNYHSFLDDNKIATSPVILNKISQLEQLDKLCAECQKLPKNKLLCNGVRPWLDEEATKYYHNMKVITSPCDKKCFEFENAMFQLRLERSYLPKEQVELISNVDFVKNLEVQYDNGFVVNGEKLSNLMFAYTKPELTKLLWELVIGFIFNNFNAKYVYPAFWYRFFKNWDNLSWELIDDCDWLVVERVDISAGADYRRQLFFSTLEQRIALNKPTLITIDKTQFLKNDFEVEFVDRIKKWDEFKI